MPLLHWSFLVRRAIPPTLKHTNSQIMKNAAYQIYVFKFKLCHYYIGIVYCNVLDVTYLLASSSMSY